MGAFGQCIALPFWLQALVLLRRIGSAACLPELKALAGEDGGAGDARGYVRRAFAALEPGASSARQTSCV